MPKGRSQVPEAGEGSVAIFFVLSEVIHWPEAAVMAWLMAHDAFVRGATVGCASTA